MKRAIRTFALPALAWLLLASPARSEWSHGVTTVVGGSGNYSHLSGCSDGSTGTFITWYDGGGIRAQHLLSDGRVDPAWPADGAVVRWVGSSLARLGTFPDRLGGLYVWWCVGMSHYVSRLDSNGAIALGWPVNGRLLATVSPLIGVAVIEDGEHGVLAAWGQVLQSNSDLEIRGIRLTPSCQPYSGWHPTSSVLIPADGILTIEMWPRLALAQDGGAFVAWASMTVIPPYKIQFRLGRFGPDGVLDPRWPGNGQALPPAEHEIADIPFNRGALLSMVSDGGVATVMVAAPSLIPYRDHDLILHQRLEDGTLPAGWPEAGRVIGETAVGDADAAVRVISDGHGGFYCSSNFNYPDSDPGVVYGHFSELSSWRPNQILSGVRAGHEVVGTAARGMFFAEYVPNGPTWIWDSVAYIQIYLVFGGRGYPMFAEWHVEPVLDWYRDIAVAPAYDHGAVFFWSQVRDRVGLFAKHIRSATKGPVPAMPGSIVEAGAERVVDGSEPLRVDFDSGRGLIVRGGGVSRVQLFDVQGRKVVDQPIEGQGDADAVVPGTERLQRGIYFARWTGVRGSGTVRIAALR